jgi:hypothetical protein
VGQCLVLAEFAYNNSYQASLKMAPFEALYGRRCCTPLNWSQTGERTLFGPKLVQEAEEKVSVIRENLWAAQMRQKSYHDKARAPREFEVGNYVYLKVSPTKGVQLFGVKGKLAPRYIGPYEVLGNSGKPVTLETLSLTEFSKYVFQEQRIRDSRKPGTCEVSNSRMCRVRES